MIKETEIGLRRQLTRMLVPKHHPVAVSADTAPLSIGDHPAILLLRQDRIGDVLVSTPVLRALREQFPNARIDMLLSTNNVAVESAVAPYLSNIIVYRKSAGGLSGVLGQIRAVRYDAVVDLMDNPSTTSTLLVRFSKARFKIGINKSNAGVYTHVVPLLDRAQVHIARRISQLLMPFGVNPEVVNLQPIYPIPAEEQRRRATALGIDLETPKRRVGINASGSGVGRRYSVDATVRVVNQLEARYPSVQFYLFSDAANADWVQQVASRTSAVSVPPSQSFHEAAIAMSLMHVIWTPDTSVVHLAAAWGTPVCVMYVHTNKNLMPWYPIGTTYEALRTETNDIANIPETAVQEAIERLFAYCGIPLGAS